MKDKDKSFDFDIDQLIRENAQAVADYENSENIENQQQDLMLPHIKQDAIVEVKIGTAFIKRLQRHCYCQKHSKSYFLS